MQLTKPLYHPVQEVCVGFEQRPDFASVAPLSAPFEHGQHLGQNVGADDQSIIEKVIGGFLSRLDAGEGAPGQRGDRLNLGRARHVQTAALSGTLPSLCIAQARLATNSAPHNWCETATQRETSVITVAMPRMTITPNAL